MVIKIPKCSNSINIHTHLKNLQTFSWCSETITFSMVKNNLFSFHNHFNLPFQTCSFLPLKMQRSSKHIIFIVILGVNNVHGKTQIDEEKVENASILVHFQILICFSFLYFFFTMCFFILCLVFSMNMMFSPFLFHTLLIILLCSLKM